MQISGSLTAGSATTAATTSRVVGNVTVTGETTVSGPLVIDRNVKATGIVTVNGDFDVASESSTTTIAGTVVLGDSSADAVEIKGLVDFENTLLITGQLTVDKDTLFQDDVTFSTTYTQQELIVEGTFSSTQSVEVNAATVVWGTTEVTADVDLADVLDCRDTLTVAGTASATADVTVPNHPVTVNGLITFQGPSLTIDTGNVEADSASFKTLAATGATIALGDSTADTLEIASGGSLVVNAPFASSTSTIAIDGSTTMGQNGATGDVTMTAGLSINAITQDGDMSAAGTSILLGDR